MKKFIVFAIMAIFLGCGVGTSIFVKKANISCEFSSTKDKSGAEKVGIATAKQNVVADICQYFEDKLSLKLEIFKANSKRFSSFY